jgi:hypothetical protein
LLCGVALAGCATTARHLQARIKEKQAVYDALPADIKQCIDQHRVKVGMSEDAVYIAWGAPSQILHSGDQAGETTSWIYYGSYMQGTPVWTYGPGSYDAYGFGAAPPQYLTYVYNPRDYVRAELVFVKGKLVRWRTLPQPLD